MKKKTLKKLLALLIACLMIVSVAACGNGSDNNGGEGQSSGPSGGPSSGSGGGSGSGKDTLVVGITQDRGTLDPTYARGASAAVALSLIYETLWDWAPDGSRIWKLATGLEMISPTVWHITLREGVTFSNGNEFDAEDVVFSLWRHNAREGHPVEFRHMDWENNKVLEKYKVEVVFNQYDLSYPYIFAQYANAFMVDKETYDEESMPSNPIGTGPYKLDEYIVNSHINLVARDDYWGDKPAIPNIHFRMFAEATQRVNALQTGTVDVIDVPFQDVGFVETLSDYNVDIMTTATTQSIFLNIAPTSVFYDTGDGTATDMKKAVALAIDRQAIVDIAYSGYATVSRYPASMAMSDTDPAFLEYGVYGTGYNPDLAREYAISSGLVDKEILLLNNGSDTNVAICELVQENLRTIGVTVNVRNLDQGSWLATIFDDTQYDAIIEMVNASSLITANAIYTWTSMANGGNKQEDPYLNSERFLEVWHSIMQVSDPNELRLATTEFVQLHADALLWYALIDEQRAVAYSTDLGGYELNRAQLIQFDKLYWR